MLPLKKMVDRLQTGEVDICHWVKGGLGRVGAQVCQREGGSLHRWMDDSSGGGKRAPSNGGPVRCAGAGQNAHVSGGRYAVTADGGQETEGVTYDKEMTDGGG